MNENDKHPRGLERVSHFFLTEEISSKEESATVVGPISSKEPSHTPNSTVQQHVVEYNQLKNTVARLVVLKKSCKGNNFTQNSENDLIWLKGAEDILQDVITNLMKILGFIDIKNK